MTEPYRSRLMPRAADELSTIFTYIDLDSPSNAVRMVERILEGIRWIERVPHREKLVVVSADRRPVRKRVVEPYVVYFKVFDEDKVVLILRIIHGARRQPKRFD